MPLPIPAILALAAACGPAASPQTLTAIVLSESGGDPLAIGVNGAQPRRIGSPDAATAARTAERLIAQGANIDLGLGQINSRNLGPLGLTAADAFDPCRNLAASARLLAADYRTADPTSGEQAALRASLSLYNTGDRFRGLRNGYVAKVTAAARRVPAFDPAPGPAEPPPALPEPPPWDVFARAARTPRGFVFQPQPSGDSQ